MIKYRMRIWNKSALLMLFALFYPYIVEKIVFWSKIFGKEIFIDLHILRFSESKNHIFSS